VKLHRLFFVLGFVTVLAIGAARHAAAAVPIAGDDTYSVNENGILTVAAPGVLANDSDPNNGLITANLIGSGPAHGALDWLYTDGSFQYTPAAGFTGTDSFQYLADAGLGPSAPATVTITVIAVNTPPVAADDSYSTSPDTGLIVVTPGVLANDSDADGDTLVLGANTQPSSGSVQVQADGSFTYTPNSGFVGTDSFTYTASDESSLSNDATVTITVNPVNPVNQSPHADGFDQIVNQDPSSFAAPGILAHASDPDGDPLTALLVNGAAHGTAAVDPSGAWTYTPDPGYVGDDGFTFQVSDGTDLSNVATLTLHVWSVPVAAVDTYSTPRNVPLVVDAAGGLLANDVDPGGFPLTAVLTGQPNNGSVVLNADGSFTYTPNAGFEGEDYFQYYPTNGQMYGHNTTETIEVGSAPLGAPESYKATQGTALTIDAASGVLANDTDPEGDPITAGLVTEPQHGTVNFNADGSFIYTPFIDFVGLDRFTYAPADSHPGNDTTVTVLVGDIGTDHLPTGNPDSYQTGKNTPLSVDAANGLLANDVDADGDPITARPLGRAAHGTVSVRADGSFTYTPETDFTGTDSFLYFPIDPIGAGTTAEVTITVWDSPTPTATPSQPRQRRPTRPRPRHLVRPRRPPRTRPTDRPNPRPPIPPTCRRTPRRRSRPTRQRPTPPTRRRKRQRRTQRTNRRTRLRRIPPTRRPKRRRHPRHPVPSNRQPRRRPSTRRTSRRSRRPRARRPTRPTNRF
jgi:hypothetical protein